MTFLHQNSYWQKHLSLCLKVCTTLFYHCTWKFTHLSKNWRFLHKMLFLLKENNASSSAHLMKKSTFFPKFQFFSHKNDSFAPKLILRETLVILPQSLHDIILSLNKMIFWNKITIFQQMKHFNENWHINKLTYPKKLKFFLSDFDTLL